MPHKQLPTNVKRIDRDEEFSFQCHPGVSCFTHCCRQLELALTPYDVLRLKKSVGLTSSAFLEKFVLIEWEETDVFPRLYLTMVDDGNASCVFITPKGCSVYQDRPGACRAYPIGRGAVVKNGNTTHERFLLLKEDHCRGFDIQSPQRTPQQYAQSQGLAPYNRFNDIVGGILQHEKIRQGMQPTEEQIDAYILALYDLDTFRKMLLEGRLPHPPHPLLRQGIEDDETLLLFAIDWLKNEFFGQH